MLAALAVALLPACGPAEAEQERGTWADAASPTPSIAATPQSPSPPIRAVTPAAAAGPACRPLTYEAVAAATGERFDVAASSGSAGSELVCVLQRAEASLPDLTYVTITGAADKESFQLDYQPRNATPVSGLGKGAYLALGPATGAGRSTVEVGWGEGRLASTRSPSRCQARRRRPSSTRPRQAWSPLRRSCRAEAAALHPVARWGPGTAGERNQRSGVLRSCPWPAR